MPVPRFIHGYDQATGEHILRVEGHEYRLSHEGIAILIVVDGALHRCSIPETKDLLLDILKVADALRDVIYEAQGIDPRSGEPY